MIDWLTGAVRFVFLETIFGTFATAAVAAAIASALVWVLRLKKSGSGVIAACAILAGLAHLFFSLGEDRYRFERETLAQLEKAPWTKVVKTTKWGDIAAPRTWFDTPVGHFVVAQPELAMGWSEEEPTLRVTILAYKQRPSVGTAEVDCVDRSALWSYPDRSGTFVYEQSGARPLTEEEHSAFCKTDWRESIDKMMDEASRQ